MKRILLRLSATALALTFAAQAYAAEWWMAETDHFIIKSRDSEKATRDFAEQLERFDGAMRTLQNMPVDDKLPSRSIKLTVYRFGDANEIGAQLGDSSVAGFFISQAGNSVAFVPARAGRNASSLRDHGDNGLDRGSVLQHEYTHYFMRQHFPAAYPMWYSEGYAELMATLRLNEDGSFHVGDPPQYRAYQVLEMRQFPLKDMLDSHHEPTGLEAYQFYGTGWLFSHYLNFDPERLAKLHEYLVALGKGEDSLEAAKRVFGDLDKMNSELLRYRKGPFPGFDVKPANYQPPNVTTRPMTDPEIAMLREEMRLNRGIEDKHAKDLAADAVRHASGFENDYGAVATLARAQVRAENFDEADRLAQKLLELDPNRNDAWLIRSDAAIERIKDDPAQGAKAREYATKAAKLDRGDPRPMINYYYSYIEAKEEPPENAIIALESVFDNAASDPAYRILLTRQLVSENRMDQALTVLLPIAFRGHDFEEDKDDADKPSMQKLLDLVTAGKRDDAIAMIDKMFDDEDEDEKKGG